MKVAAILPAYNEAARVADVVSAVRGAGSVDEVIVVNDGSTDGTAERVLDMKGVCLISLPSNRGKGGAMASGAKCTDADVLLFLDADLIGLTSGHVESLLEPVLSGRALMSVGKFRGGRRLTDLSQRIAPSISGQRAIRRDVFEQISGIAETRFGVEMQITRFCRYYRIPTVAVVLRGVTHPMKEEKLGILRGWASRSRMYYEIVRIMMNPRAPRRAARRLPKLPKLVGGTRNGSGAARGLLARLQSPRRRTRNRL